MLDKLVVHRSGPNICDWIQNVLTFCASRQRMDVGKERLETKAFIQIVCVFLK